MSISTVALAECTQAMITLKKTMYNKAVLRAPHLVFLGINKGAPQYLLSAWDITRAQLHRLQFKAGYRVEVS